MNNDHKNNRDFDKWASTYDSAVESDDWMYKDYKKILNKVVEYANIVEDEYYGLFESLEKKFLINNFTFTGEQLTDFVWILSAKLDEGGACA